MNCLHTQSTRYGWHVILENSVAKLDYESGPGTQPGTFRVMDKIRDQQYWLSHCYDGGEGRGNKEEWTERCKGIAQFVKLTNLYHKLLTPEDRASVAAYDAEGNRKKISRTLKNGITVTIEGAIDGCSIDENGIVYYPITSFQSTC